MNGLIILTHYFAEGYRLFWENSGGHFGVWIIVLNVVGLVDIVQVDAFLFLVIVLTSLEQLPVKGKITPWLLLWDIIDPTFHFVVHWRHKKLISYFKSLLNEFHGDSCVFDEEETDFSVGLVDLFSNFNFFL